MMSILPAGIGGSLCAESDDYAKRRDRLGQIYADTKSCLGEVDYSHHFDPRLYSEAILTPAEESDLQENFHRSPCFLVLGASVYAKAAFVNEILGFAALPVVAAEAAEEKQQLEEEKWRSVLFINRLRPGHCGGGSSTTASSEIAARLITKTQQQQQQSVLRPDDDSLGIVLRNLAIDPHKCGLYESDLRCTEESSSSSFVSFQLPHPLLNNGVTILVPNYDDDADQLAQLVRYWSKKHVLIGIYVFTTPTLTGQDLDNLTSLNRAFPADSSMTSSDPSASLLQGLFFVHSRTYTRSSELPESDRQQQQTAPRNAAAAPQSSPQFLFFSGDWNGGSASTYSSVISQQLEACGFQLKPKAKDAQGAPKNSGADKNEPPTDKKPVVNFPWAPAGARMIAEQQQQRANGDVVEDEMDDGGRMFSELVSEAKDLAVFAPFSRRVLRSHLLGVARSLNRWQESLMTLFDMTAFDMARDQIITPKRLAYARNKELELYLSLNTTLARQESDLARIVGQVLENGERARILEEISRRSCFGDEDEDEEDDFCQNNDEESATPAAGDYNRSITCVDRLQRRVLVKLNRLIGDRMTSSFCCLRQTFIGTLTRCLASLENKTDAAGSVYYRSTSASESCASNPTTTNNATIIEAASGPELPQNREASAALKQIMCAAYNLELTLAMCTPFRCLLWDRLKETFCGASDVNTSSTGGPQRNRIEQHQEDDDDEQNQRPACHDEQWRRRVVEDTFARVSQSKLEKAVCAKFRERIRSAHESFQATFTNLEAFHTERLRKAEEQRLRLRKQHAPRLARVAMESMAIRDSLTHGMPKLGAEVGRGQYGVVYSSERWGKYKPCAVKSVVPPDDKHWNDLALEFHYTKRVPEHERIVRLLGAVIDHSYGAGQSGTMPAVLLVMERMVRDLHSAIRAGLPFPDRVRVALDVVEGLRFLHSQGLVHRDIKLKNVLLNDENRAKITDLGFCKPEAMMSGSVVGTPIHMAPELFSGQYDSSVDVYAFGVLFWYICAGHVRIPQAFEQCASKDQLWHSVKRGVRPEQLACFDAQCWDIMRHCWSGEPCKRPYLGDIQPQIEALWTEKVREHERKSDSAARTNRQAS